LVKLPINKGKLTYFKSFDGVYPPNLIVLGIQKRELSVVRKPRNGENVSVKANKFFREKVLKNKL